MIKAIYPARKLVGHLTLGGDKSISHRAIILSSLTSRKVRIKNFYPSQDCLSSLQAMRKLGVKIKQSRACVIDIYGVGLEGLNFPKSLFLGDSGTTYRLLAGLLAGKNCKCLLKAGSSLSKRPMKRIIKPLTQMGAKVRGSDSEQEIYPPLLIEGGNLKSIEYTLPVASAQVKSAILLAGLSAKGATKIIEKVKTRDHTERILARFGANISVIKNRITLIGPSRILVAPKEIDIPGDFSSAAFFIVGTLLLVGSNLRIKNVSINPTRIGLLKVLKRMKANIKLTNIRNDLWPFEPVADINIRYSKLQATKITSDEIPLLIDELPIFMVAASLAYGTTRICGAEELKVKEADRIKSMVYNLKNMGVEIKVEKNKNCENILIKGREELHSACLKSFSDHRTAMSMVIASLCTKKTSYLDDTDCISKSFPDFFKALNSIKG
jgi:3-phosphoshikimate 1-carboxyvinyltransferase